MDELHIMGDEAGIHDDVQIQSRLQDPVSQEAAADVQIRKTNRESVLMGNYYRKKYFYFFKRYWKILINFKCFFCQ